MNTENINNINLKFNYKDSVPTPTLTNRIWQQKLRIAKKNIKPLPESRVSIEMCKEFVKERLGTKYVSDDVYDYCSFLNSIIDTLRDGYCDYCYYIYQIYDLLRILPNIKSKYYPDEKYFVVYL